MKPILGAEPVLSMIPDIEIDTDSTSIILISEAPPDNLDDYYYSSGNPLFEQTTVQAFQDAGRNVNSISDIVNLGVYLTTAIKCAKTGYGVKAQTIKECSKLLEDEIKLFPNIKGYLLMGDVAIKSINYISKRLRQERAIPAGSTYKIRNGNFTFLGVPAFPSYTQAGPAFFIEKSKRRMISEDITKALELL